MLQAQELALEVGHMIKFFSSRGWLSRLNRPDVDDELEFDRLCNRLNVLQEHCGSTPSSNADESEIYRPSSGSIMKIIKTYGPLQKLVNKTDDELHIFVEHLLPHLSVDPAQMPSPISEEIRIAASAEMPGSHTVIRHPDLRYLWWTYLESEEAPWEDFWKFFPDALEDLESGSEIIGDVNAIKGLLQSASARRQFKTSINSSRNSDVILSIELDNAFAPSRTIEESIAILLSPMDEQHANIHYMERFLTPAVKYSLQRIIRDEAGVPGDGSDIVGREAEVGKLFSSIEMGKSVLLVTGPPGIGKTAIAATACDELLQSRVLKRVHYLNLSNVGELTDAIFRIGAALKHPIYQSALSSGKAFCCFYVLYSSFQGNGRG